MKTNHPNLTLRLLLATALLLPCFAHAQTRRNARSA